MADATLSATAAGVASLGWVLSSWQPTAGVLAACGVAAGLYALAVARRARAWPARRTLAFTSGVVAVVVSLDSGLDVYSDRLASLHMVQHLALTLVAAPLLAAGAPMTLALGATRGSTRAGLVRIIRSAPVAALSRPVTSWLLFVGVIVGWHLSPLYEESLRHPLLHELEHLLLLTTAVLFWAQVVGVDPLPHRLGPIGRMLYLLAAMPAMSVIGLWLVVSRTVRYPAYLAPTRMLGVSPLHDQHIAGVIMWGGDALLGAITLLIACGALLQEERRAAARDAHRTLPVPPAGIAEARR
jgi:cytochrome c oxidase assembly factor CtaG